VPSIEKAMSLLDYQPRVSLESGVARTIPWYAANLSALVGKPAAQPA